jgi:hypothetical protein
MPTLINFLEENMMQEKFSFFVGTFLLIILLYACQTPSAEIQLHTPTDNLSPSELSIYNDSFDSFNNFLWDTGAMTWSENQHNPFEPATVEAKDGKLSIVTKGNGFSDGNIISKFKLVGDFDFQVDCDFKLADRQSDADQIMGVSVIHGDEDAKDFSDHDFASVAINEFYNANGQFRKGRLRFFRKKSGKNWENWDGPFLREFHGTMRIKREGERIISWYRVKGGSFKQIGSSSFTSGKVRIAMMLRNFIIKRSSISNPSVLSATFDNFIVNQSQGIEEDEI